VLNLTLNHNDDQLHQTLKQLLPHSYSARWCMDGRAAYHLWHAYAAAAASDKKPMTEKIELFLSLAVQGTLKDVKENKGSNSLCSHSITFESNNTKNSRCLVSD